VTLYRDIPSINHTSENFLRLPRLDAAAPSPPANYIETYAECKTLEKTPLKLHCGFAIFRD
jgi:hypothetical protein